MIGLSHPSSPGPASVLINDIRGLSAPTTADDCRNGDRVLYGFKDQGQCVRFVEAGKDSR